MMNLNMKRNQELPKRSSKGRLIYGITYYYIVEENGSRIFKTRIERYSFADDYKWDSFNYYCSEEEVIQEIERLNGIKNT